MEIRGYYTVKGLALSAKLLAGDTLVITRVAAGSGQTETAASTLAQECQQLAVNTPVHNGDTAAIPVTLTAAQAAEDYALAELGVYAQDPDEGEILYKIYRLDASVDVSPASRMVLRFYLEETVSQDLEVEVICSPAGLLTESDLAAPDGVATLDGNGVLAKAQRPTAEMLGAAPAGYGLGVIAGDIDLTDCDLAVANGWYDCDSATLNTPSGVAACCYGELFVVSRGDDKTQIFYPTGRASPTSVLLRWRRDGVWQPWEWVNPPMELGVEYRTTERYLGKPVYARAVDFGALPNATAAAITIDDTGYVYDQIVGCYGTTSDHKTIPALTYGWGGIASLTTGVVELAASANSSGLRIMIATQNDLSGVTATVIVKYTKLTD